MKRKIIDNLSFTFWKRLAFVILICWIVGMIYVSQSIFHPSSEAVTIGSRATEVHRTNLYVSDAVVSNTNPIPVKMGTSQTVGLAAGTNVVGGVRCAMSTSRKETSQDLSAGALSYTTNFAAKTRIKQVLIHASGNITETITVSFNSTTGANYDTTLASESLVSEADYAYTPDELVLLSGDELTITCTNNGGANTVYVTAIGETLL